MQTEAFIDDDDAIGGTGLKPCRTILGLGSLVVVRKKKIGKGRRWFGPLLVDRRVGPDKYALVTPDCRSHPQSVHCNRLRSVERATVVGQGW
jgi:hypothetical protein